MTTKAEQKGNRKTTYVATDPDCYNNLYSQVLIQGPDGNEIDLTSTEQGDFGPVPTWANIPAGSKIQWAAVTTTDGAAQSDRVQVELTVLDSKYIAQITDDVMNGLSPEEEEMFLTDVQGISTIIYDRVMEVMEPELAMKAIYSTVVNSDANGRVGGTIPFQPQWPKGAYSFLIHYGYHSQSEASDSQKAWDFWVVEMGPMIIEIVLITIIGIFTGGVGFAVGAAIFTATVIADIAIMYSQYQKDGFGMTGLDQYDCAFPDGGWTHIYGVGLEIEEAEQEMGNEISPQNASLLTGMENYIIAEGMVTATLIGTIGIAFVLIFMNALKRRGRK